MNTDEDSKKDADNRFALNLATFIGVGAGLGIWRCTCSSGAP